MSRHGAKVLCVCAALTISCSQTCVQQESDRISAQRGLGQRARDELGYAVEIVPGLIPLTQPLQDTTKLRASAMVAQLELAQDTLTSAPIKLQISNVHPDVEAHILSHQPLDAISAYSGLPLTQGRQGCALPQENAGVTTCTDDDRTGLCADPVLTRDSATTITLELPASPCTGITLEIKEPVSQREQEVRFAVIGRTRSPAGLSNILTLIQRTEPVDFYVFLGDGNQDNENNYLGSLSSVAAQSPAPLILVPGADEIEDGILPFGQRFGAFDFRWTFRGVQFATFYSADRELGLRGVSALESLLVAMAREDQRMASIDGQPITDAQVRRWPAIAFTHSPLFDPVGLRDRGLRSRIEAARALSALSRFGVSTLFAGGQTEPTIEGESPTRYITSAYRDALQSNAEYLIVTLSDEASSGAIAAGDRFMRVESRELPDQL